MLSTPDITKAQVGTIVAALVAVLAVIQTAPVRLQVPLVIVLGVIAVALILADAVIRYGRARGNASKNPQA